MKYSKPAARGKKILAFQESRIPVPKKGSSVPLVNKSEDEAFLRNMEVKSRLPTLKRPVIRTSEPAMKTACDTVNDLPTKAPVDRSPKLSSANTSPVVKRCKLQRTYVKKPQRATASAGIAEKEPALKHNVFALSAEELVRSNNQFSPFCFNETYCVFLNCDYFFYGILQYHFFFLLDESERSIQPEAERAAIVKEVWACS